MLAYEGAALAAPLAETWAPQLADAVKRAGASALVGTATSTGKDVLPRAAALLGAGMASDVTGVLGAKEFKRPAYAGNAIESVEVSGAVLVASVRQTAFAPGGARRGGRRRDRGRRGGRRARRRAPRRARHEERAPRLCATPRSSSRAAAA